MEMADIIVKVMVEVLLALALVMEYIKQGNLSELLYPLIDCLS